MFTSISNVYFTDTNITAVGTHTVFCTETHESVLKQYENIG